MRHFYLFRASVIGLLMVCNISLLAQGYHVKQVITGNGGKFEYAPPFLDYVTLQTYDPVNQATEEFGTIFTQSVQDILIVDHFAYVTAQDSIVKYNLNTMKRVAAVADSGLNKIAVCQGRLVITKQYPLTRYFATIRDTTDLSLIENVDGISGDCQGVVSVNDSVYIAINGGWAGTEGKIAVIDPQDWTLVREIQLGTDAVGIANLYLYNEKILSVNKTPYGAPVQGSITTYDPFTGLFTNTIYEITIGNGVDICDSTLFVMMNEGIGVIYLPTMEIADTSRIADPGSAGFIYITSAAFDTISDLFYVNIGDYMSPGYCLVADLTGDSVTSYSTGINAEAIAIDYRENMVGILDPEHQTNLMALSIYPNPATEWIHVTFESDMSVNEITIIDLYGKVVMKKAMTGTNERSRRIDISDLPVGLYCLVVNTPVRPFTHKFVKR